MGRALSTFFFCSLVTACVASDEPGTNTGRFALTGSVCPPDEVWQCYSGPGDTDSVGACQRGEKTCNGVGTGYGDCIGEIVPTVELCDGVDNDCDGIVDDDCLCTPGEISSCYEGPIDTDGVGVCVAGTHVCNGNGVGHGACDGVVLPSAEVCGDGLDNDCDGQVDQGCICPPGEVWQCYCGPGVTDSVGACQRGEKTCDANGMGYGPCVGEVVPTFEACGNGVDDDCDGAIDELSAEICGDGFDNDCDGLTDNGFACAQIARPTALPTFLTPSNPVDLRITVYVSHTGPMGDVRLWFLAGTGSPSTLVGSLNDQGVGGDAAAGDHVYAILVPAALALDGGTHGFRIEAFAPDGSAGLHRDFRVPVVAPVDIADDAAYDQTVDAVLSDLLVAQAALAEPWSTPEDAASNLAIVREALMEAYRGLDAINEAETNSPTKVPFLKRLLPSTFRRLIDRIEESHAEIALMEADPSDPRLREIRAWCTMVGLDHDANCASEYQKTVPGSKFHQALDESRRVIVKTQIGQYVGLAGGSVADLYELGIVSTVAVDSTVNKLVDVFVDEATGADVLLVGQMNGTESMPAGTHEMVMTFGGQAPRSIVREVRISVGTDTHLVITPGEVDSDGDRVSDGVDNCEAVSNAGQADADGDGIGDVCDTRYDDIIGRWYLQDDSSCNETYGNANTIDFRIDGRFVRSGSGYLGLWSMTGDDISMLLPSGAATSYYDGTVDAALTVMHGTWRYGSSPAGCWRATRQHDADNDGVDDLFDNCPFVANGSQTDIDHDAIGDACDGFVANLAGATWALHYDPSCTNNYNAADTLTFQPNGLWRYAGGDPGTWTTSGNAVSMTRVTFFTRRTLVAVVNPSITVIEGTWVHNGVPQGCWRATR